MLLASECIAPGDCFLFNADSVCDGDDGACLEFEGGPGGADFVNGGGIVAIDQHVAAPLADSDDEDFDFKVRGAFHCVKTSRIRFWAFSYSAGEPSGNSNQLIMYFIWIQPIEMMTSVADEQTAQSAESIKAEAVAWFLAGAISNQRLAGKGLFTTETRRRGGHEGPRGNELPADSTGKTTLLQNGGATGGAMDRQSAPSDNISDPDLALIVAAIASR